MLEGFFRDLKFSIRTLRRGWGFTLVAVATTALGVAGSTALFSIIRGALVEPWPYTAYERIVTFRANSPRLARAGFPLWSTAEYRDVADRTDIFDYVIAGEGRGATFGSGANVDRIAVAAMTANTWSMLGVRPLLGRTFDRQDDRPGGPRVAVLNYRFWRNHLGARRNILGATIEIDRIPFTVIGVMPPEFVWWDRDVWMPLQLDPAAGVRNERRWYLEARLRADVSRSRAEAALRTMTTAWQRDYRLEEYEGLTIDLAPLVAETLRDVRPVLYVLFAAVGLVLAVASANVATLLLIRGVRRRGEVAMKLALGASRARIARQLIFENLVVATLSGIAGLWIAAVILQPLVSLIPSGIPAEAHIAIDWRAAAFALAIADLCGVAFGVAPVLRAVGGDVAADLKESNRRGASAAPRTLDGFMAAQFATALVVVSATLTVVPSFIRTLAADPGYNPAGVLTFRAALPAQAGAIRETALVAVVARTLAALPGVRSVAAATTAPIGEGPRASFSHGDEPSQMDANVDAVSPGYFEALQTPIVDGRDFTDHDNAGVARVAIVNATLARRLWPTGSAVGSRLIWRERSGGPAALTVVGVAADIKRDALRPAAAAVFVPVAQEPASAMTFFVRASGDDEGLFAAARSAVATAAPDVPLYSPRMLARLRTDALGSERLAAVLLTAFAVIALVLSIVGMYGVTRYTVEQRAGELAVRVALGATRRDVVALVLGRSVRNLALGAAAGACGGWIAFRTISALMVGVDGTAPAVIAGAVLPLVAATLAAAYAPARRAAMIDPVDALRRD